MDANECKRSRSSDQDLISQMPEDIRLHILSMLPRKYAIRTGVLSTDWKDSWKYRFPHRTILIFLKATDNVVEQKIFAQEIQKTMSDHGDKKIEIFGLYFYPGKEHEKEASQWVEQAVKNGVEDLFLNFAQASFGSYPNSKISARAARFELKEKLFKHGSNCVMYFTLHYCRLQRLFKFKQFSNLEVIRLQQVNINDFMFGKLMLNCRKLQIVHLIQCRYLQQVVDPDVQKILKQIVIANCHSITRIEISAPGLCSFYFTGLHPTKFRLNDNMQSLSDVVLISSATSMCYHQVNRFISPMHHLRFVNVQLLTLCSISLKVMIDSDMFMKSKITLDNLKELHLIMHSLCYADIRNIYCLFDNCKQPILLKKLFIELPKRTTIDNNNNTNIMPPPNKNEVSEDKLMWRPSNKTFEHLKIIKISNYKGEPNEYMLLYLLMLGALNLKVAVVVFNRKLVTFPLDELILRTMKMRGSSPKAKIFTCPPYSGEDTFNSVHSDVIKKLEPFIC